MGNRTVHFCDFCKREFGVPGRLDEPFKCDLRGMRYTDAAGSPDRNTLVLEMHKSCWQRFIEAIAAKVQEGSEPNG